MANVIVFLLLFAVPLAVSPVLGDQFTAVKWYLLELLALVWALAEALTARVTPVPDVIPRHTVPLLALGALTLANTLRGGLAWGAEPLLARVTFVALAVCSYAYFTRNGGDLTVVHRSLTCSLIVVTTLGLAQVLGLTSVAGLEPLFGLAAGDGRSATFGNANMAAQFVGFALALRVALRAAQPLRAEGWRAWAHPGLDAAGIAYVFLAGARSAMLAVAVAFIVTGVGARRRGARAALGPVALAALLALPVAAAALWSRGGAEPPPGRLDHPLKTESLRIRLRLWQDAAVMIRDRPLGAGSGNFLHAFLPYQLGDEGLRSEAVVYGSPHSELLRAPAEEGVLWCALAGYLLLRLFAAVRRRVRRDGWMPPALAAGATFLAVESAFQFPFAMAFGCLAAAVLLGLALSLADGSGVTSARPRRAALRLGLAAGAVVAGAVLSRLVVSDALGATAGPDARRQARACDLNPRNLRACLAAAWLDARAGQRREARARAAAILERSPHYHPAVKLLADESLAGGDERTGCFHLWIYDQLFDGRSSQHERLSSLCDPALLETFPGRVAVPGYTRFPLAIPARPR